MRKLVVVSLAVMALATAARADGETIAVFTKNQTNPYFQDVRTGADNAAKQLNAKVSHYVPTKPDNILEQLSEIDDVIIRKPNAIVFIPVDYKALVPGVQKINAANIPVVNIVDRLAGGKIVSFVGGDDYTTALITGRRLLNELGGKGNVIILEGVKGALTSDDRTRGFTAAIKEFPGVKLVATQSGNYQRLQALQVMENLLQSFPQVDGVLAANDAMATGVIEALEGANRKALVTGLNGTKEAIDLIKSGKLLASGSYDGFLQGCIGTMIAIRNLRQQPVPAEFVLKAISIDKTNYQPYDIPTAQRTCPTWDVATSG